jgi:type I restriction enzyme, R subunit
LKIALDQHGYTETRLRTAWAEKTNQDIAASIIGFVRQQALGSPLVSYEERVKKAMQRIYQMQRWTGVQRQWLKRIEQQLNKEFIVDRDSLDRGAFKAKGGFRIINKVFDGRLEELLGTLQEAVWEDVG